MQIDYIVCPEHIEDKLESKHDVTVQEAREVLLNKPRIRLLKKVIQKEKMCMRLLDKPMKGAIYPYFLCINQLPKQRSSLVRVI